MAHSTFLQILLSSRRGTQRGFGLLLALLAALVTMVSAISLLIRGQEGMLGIAQQSESRMAREAAEAGLNSLIAELNRPGNRRLLVSTVPFTSWRQRWNSPDDSQRNGVSNPCLYRQDPGDPTSAQTRLSPSESMLTMVAGSTMLASLPTDGAQARFRRRFTLESLRVSNRDHSRWYLVTRRNDTITERSSTPAFFESLINFNNNPGYIKLVVRGDLLPADEQKNDVLASVTVAREWQIIPKCCQRSLGGPGQIFGNDFRWCTSSPPFVVGLGNGGASAKGGVDILTSTFPELRLRDDPKEPAPEILCYMPADKKIACPGVSEVKDVSNNKNIPVRTDDIQFPALPRLNAQGLPCDASDSTCTNSFKPEDAYSIELFNYENGAVDNSPTQKYAKDYLRVAPGGGRVEICNKTYTSDPQSPYYAKPGDANNPADIDKTPTIVDGSCIDLSKYCAKKDVSGFATFHCRIRNIFVNDFGATSDGSVRQNNSLFIDTSNGPIYLYIYSQWAKTRDELAKASPIDPVLERMQQFFYNVENPPSNFAPVYTVGGYNDGQIQHVRCQPYSNSDFACTDTAKAAQEMSRAEIISDIVNNGITKQGENSDDYTALIGDDGFVRDIFFWMPYASFHLAGDPAILDLGGDLAQGKPQLSAGLWVNTFRFTRRSSELYLPSRRSQFFPFLLSPDSRLAAAIHDWVARGSSFASFFHQQP